MTGFRLGAGGSGIDRARPVRFTWDGRAMTGLAGDTLASALLANGVRVVARSFKYHRPRGITSAGPEEPTALVTVGRGARAEPNAKAPMVPLFEGLAASGQNAWPSVRFDVGAVNGLAGGAIAAGFYYKTFIGGPYGTWTRLFEPLIRRAAGMGRAPVEPDPDRYETVHAFPDVLVVGAGPAGLMAATVAAEAGARVLIADDREAFGGALLAERGEIDGLAGPVYAARLADAPGSRATVLARTTVYGHNDGLFGAVERVADHVADPGEAPRQRHWLIRPRQVILATGAIERPVVFAGNDTPGVMLADAARHYVNRFAAAPGRTVAVFAAHDGTYRAVADLAAAGIAVAAVVDVRAEVSPAATAVARAAGAELLAGHRVAAVRGTGSLRIEAEGAGGTRRIAADALLVSAGWTPAIHLTAQAGGRAIWDDTLAAFRPGALPDTWQAVGAMDGTFGTAACLSAGARAGAAAVRELGLTPPAVRTPEVPGELVGDAPMPLFHVRGRGKAFVDLQHDVTAADVALAHDEGFVATEHLKRYTTLGMATDQGKTSGLNGAAIMADLTGSTVAAVGTPRFRPPTTPVALGALAGQAVGADVRPLRRAPLHDWHVAQRGVMVAVGAFQRPRAYLKPGETVREAYIREATSVRRAVGIVDVSTLGKIEVAGPDAAAFLDRVYVNGWSQLPVGKARYGVMLRDDGVVFDDGTTWRLEENRFLMTTTTANAAAVLSHLEILLATAWPELRVHVTSVTEEWASMAVAGPRSRETLAALTDVDLSDGAFPFMGVRRGTVAGVPALLARLSFSGERAWEVFVGAHHGLHVWEAILAAGAPYGIVPYGLEAMGTLRIEKGHVAGGELDGRTTLDDLGLGGLASGKKPFVGGIMRQRPALTDEGRLRLVGLRSLSGKPIRTGSQLSSGGRSEGHVTASTWSPSLGAEIALGLLARGTARHGERISAVYPLRDEWVEVEVVPPVFVDPEGSRLRG